MYLRLGCYAVCGTQVDALTRAKRKRAPPRTRPGLRAVDRDARGGLSSVFANYYFVSVIVPTVMGSVVCGVTVNVLPEFETQ